MGKNLEPQYAFRCDELTIKKLEFIAKKNTRTRNQEMKHIIKSYIKQYESEHGEIEITSINNSPQNLKEMIEEHKRIMNNPDKGLLAKLKESYAMGEKTGAELADKYLEEKENKQAEINTSFETT